MSGNRKSTPASAVDVEELLSLCEDDGDMLAEMLRAFGEDEPRLFAAVEKALQTGDVEKLREGAHALKGVLGALAALPGRELALELERAGREGNLEEARRLVPLLGEELERVAQILHVMEGALSHEEDPA